MNLIPDITLGGASLLVLIGILVSVIKSLNVPTRYLPMASIVLGVILGYASYLTGNVSLIQGLIGGIVIGASVSGIYDFGKTTLLNK